MGLKLFGHLAHHTSTPHPPCPEAPCAPATFLLSPFCLEDLPQLPIAAISCLSIYIPPTGLQALEHLSQGGTTCPISLIFLRRSLPEVILFVCLLTFSLSGASTKEGRILTGLFTLIPQYLDQSIVHSRGSIFI